MSEKSVFRARLRLSDPLVYSAGSLTALFAVSSTILTASVSLWFWFYALGNPYVTDLDPVAAYAPFIWYSFLAFLGYAGSRLFFGRKILQFINNRRESAASLALCIIFVALLSLTYMRFGLNYFSLALWIDFVTIMVLAPIAEEIFYRMFFLTVLAKATQKTLLSVILNSLIFALAHLGVIGGPSIEFLFGVLPFSIFVGLAFLYTRSLDVAIGLHCAFNAVGFFLGYLL